MDKTTRRDELDIMRDLWSTLDELPDQGAKLRALRWLHGVIMGAAVSVGRGLSDKWQRVMGEVGDKPTFTLDDVAAGTAARAYGVKRNALRSQIHNYTTRGWLAHTDEAGTYEWTPSGRHNLLSTEVNE